MRVHEVFSRVSDEHDKNNQSWQYTDFTKALCAVKMTRGFTVHMWGIHLRPQDEYDLLAAIFRSSFAASASESVGEFF
jgi:hypothetical protein